jgi:hypothetical protein
MTVLIYWPWNIRLLAFRKSLGPRSRGDWPHSRRFFYRVKGLHSHFASWGVGDVRNLFVHDRAAAFAHHHIVIVQILAVCHRRLYVVERGAVGCRIPPISIQC